MSDPNRQAIDTIRGYLYQFDSTILQILNHEDENTIFTVEGIEDIDIHNEKDVTTAVQCKYYQESEFQPSVIKSAISWMVKDFSKRLNEQKDFIKYKLYGHYKTGQQRLPTSIDVSYLKTTFLTSTTRSSKEKPSETIELHSNLGLSDKNLEDFVNLLEININAPSFDEQYNQILEKIVNLGLCSSSDVEFFYNKSLYIIRNLAKSKKEAERTIIRRDFILALKESKEILFDYWFAHQKEIKKYCSMIKNKYFSDSQSPKNRFFLIEKNNLNELELLDLIKYLSIKWSSGGRVTREPEKFCPFIYIHNIDEETLIRIKCQLIRDGFLFEDGYYYKGANFEIDLFLRNILDIKNEYRARLKIINELNELKMVIDRKPKNLVISEFFSNTPFSEINGTIKIYFKNFEYLKGILV